MTIKTAYLYIRVSTDEQADKGYSQRHQEEVLRKYCSCHGIEVRKVYLEDHSAKTFNRPQWKRLLLELKKKREAPDLVLFTKWDRFSRNAGDAYQMLALLWKLGVEPQAIEQPIDLSVPENKIMLAVYLATPEVENDRRALNVRNGMRRALKEGRWMGPAPYGYVNKITEDGRKYIAPKEPVASVLRWVFEEVAYGTGTVNSVWNGAKHRGLTIVRSHFYTLLRNPVYAGLIFVPKFREEAARCVRGHHKGIITRSLFDQVQAVLDGRRKIYQTQRPADLFPWRGFVACPICGKLLTASASNGRTLRYYYYHCMHPCNARMSSPVTNVRLEHLLQGFRLSPSLLPIFHQLVNDQLEQATDDRGQERQRQVAERNRREQRLTRARDLLLSGDLDATEYRAIKQETEQALARLEEQAASFVGESPDKLPRYPNDNLVTLYRAADRKGKRALASALFTSPWTVASGRLHTHALPTGLSLAYSHSR